MRLRTGVPAGLRQGAAAPEPKSIPSTQCILSGRALCQEFFSAWHAVAAYLHRQHIHCRHCSECALQERFVDRFAVQQKLYRICPGPLLVFHTNPMSTGVESNQHWWDELFDIGRVSSTLGCCEQDRWENLYLKLCNASTCNSTSLLTEQRSSEADAVHYASSQTRARWQPHYTANEVAG